MTTTRLGRILAGLAATLLLPVSSAQAGTDAAYDRLAHPVRGTAISTGYGERGPHWSEGVHTGVDFRAPRGTAVVALTDGVVIRAGRSQPWAGIAVVIRAENGHEIWNAHLSRTAVKRGERVTAGDLIGEIGDTGNATGPHLHLGVWTDTGWIDPTPIVRAARP